jgi:hypothetical protein
MTRLHITEEAFIRKVGHWINADEYDGMPWGAMDGERCGRYGARAVRTVPAKSDRESPLVMDPLPNLTGYDLALFYLPGRFNNTGDKPPKGWQALTSGAVLQWPEGTTLPSHGSSVVAATRVEAPPGGQEVVLKARQEKAAARFGVRAWFNDQLVFESHLPKGKDAKLEETAKPFRFRAAGNTLVVECMSEEDGAATPGNVVMGFSDAKNGKPVYSLLFDADKR